jgi:hypothetical protein
LGIREWRDIFLVESTKEREYEEVCELSCNQEGDKDDNRNTIYAERLAGYHAGMMKSSYFGMPMNTPCRIISNDL